MKKRVTDQFGEDARLILDSIDMSKVTFRREAGEKAIDDSKAIIHLSGLSKKYQPRNESVDALNEVDLSSLKEMVAVIGPSRSAIHITQMMVP